MDIVRFKGGLGNQMFQYALVEALRSKGRNAGSSLGFYKKHPDLRPFMLKKVFPEIDLNEVEEALFEKIDERWKKIKSSKEKTETFKQDIKNRFFYVEEEDGKFDSNIFKTENCAFVGYWQTEKYFSDIKEKIKKIFEFKNLESKLYSLGEQLSGCYVGVHIRRSDYLENNLFYTVHEDYYGKAMNYMQKMIPEAKFIFFSDDKKWIWDHYKLVENGIICKPELFNDYQDWYDMYLMTLCRGNIIANSSFSWWGAWLSKIPNQIVAAPKVWFNGCETPDIWCEQWIRM